MPPPKKANQLIKTKSEPEKKAAMNGTQILKRENQREEEEQERQEEQDKLLS